MDFKQILGKLKIEIDEEVELQLSILLKSVYGQDPMISQSLEQTKKIALAGGKRIRGALLCQAYFGAGGKEKKKILKVAAAIELVHLFLLIHDDIIDRGQLRHGKETIHETFAKKKRKAMPLNEAVHFGESMAIIAGDMLHAFATAMIIEAGFNSDVTLKALSHLQSIINTTIVGQSQDIGIAYDKKVSEAQVLSMCENKTARYTFVGPLHLGVILAEKNDRKLIKILSDFALPLGKAFQIQDDILGVFGNEQKMGKSAASDIEEGKQSLMVVRARKSATPAQKKLLESLLGKKNITKKEIAVFKGIIESTGSLAYCHAQVQEYLAMSKSKINKIAMNVESKDFLIGLVEYLEKRES